MNVLTHHAAETALSMSFEADVVETVGVFAQGFGQTGCIPGMASVEAETGNLLGYVNGDARILEFDVTAGMRMNGGANAIFSQARADIALILSIMLLQR